MFAFQPRIGRGLVFPFTLCGILGLSGCQLPISKETAHFQTESFNSPAVLGEAIVSTGYRGKVSRGH